MRPLGVGRGGIAQEGARGEAAQPRRHKQMPAFSLGRLFTHSPHKTAASQQQTMLPPRLLLLAAVLTLAAATPRQPLPSPIDGDVQKVNSD